MELTNKIINSFLALCASAALGACGMYLYNKDKIELAEECNLVSECKKILESEKVELPENADVNEAVLRGYLTAYDDKYTFYTSKTNDDETYLASVNGMSCLVTCGYRVGLTDDGRIEVVNVTAGSVAEKQGLKTGDIILSIDGEVIAEKGIVPTALNLSGKDGTEMKLVIERNGKKTNLNFLRSNDYDKQVENVMMKVDNRILYVKISSVDNYLYASYNDKLQEINSGYDKIIIDLRDNVGGLTEGSVQFADSFIGDGHVDLYYKTGKKEVLNTYDSVDDCKMPMVVLCNEHTASAAEILTALLKQYGEDVSLVGAKTFGKGIFQREKELSTGGRVRYTAGYYTVGDWECYHEIGIKPDVEVEMDSSFIGTDKDIQLEKAYEILG